MSKPTLDMWDQILTTYNDVLSQAESSYLAKAKSKSSNEPVADSKRIAVQVMRMIEISLHSALDFGYR